MKKFKLTIQGMHCASCGTNVARSLKKIEGVKDASVNVMARKAFVESDGEISEEELKKAVSRAGGYKLVSVEES